MRLSALLATVLFSTLATGQKANPSNPDSFKSVLDHLAALVTERVPDWRYHDDIPHPEDPSLDDSNWARINADPSIDDNAPNHWKGVRVFRRAIEVPPAINGYSTRKARVKLDLNFGSDAAMVITVFLNGGLVFHGSQEQQQPVLLTEDAEPGQKFLIAVRVDALQVDTALFRSNLQIEPPTGRPDPSLIREEVLATIPLISAYTDGREDREKQLTAAVRAIEFLPLKRGDQDGFDRSLRDAQQKLKLLRPWMQQFTIRAVGNSHIDMAWLWPWTETVEVVRNTFRSVLN